MKSTFSLTSTAEDFRACASRRRFGTSRPKGQPLRPSSGQQEVPRVNDEHKRIGVQLATYDLDLLVDFGHWCTLSIVNAWQIRVRERRAAACRRRDNKLASENGTSVLGGVGVLANKRKYRFEPFIAFTYVSSHYNPRHAADLAILRSKVSLSVSPKMNLLCAQEKIWTADGGWRPPVVAGQLRSCRRKHVAWSVN